MILMEPRKEDKLKVEIENLKDALIHTDPASPDYGVIADNLDKLVNIRNSMKSKKLGVSKETIIKTGAVVAELLIVLYFEETQIITTKAFGLIPRIKF